jgi:spermidine synthase
MRRWGPPVLAFLTAAAVLVMEIVAARLLAPYVGVTLQTYTAIIGTVLAGISVGAFVGGRLADQMPPARLLGPVIILGGGLVLAALPVLRIVGDAVGSGSSGAVALAGAAFLLPAFVLSMVSPILIKETITSIATAGSAVGRIEAAGTAGAIVGTFVAGFVLVARFGSDSILIGEGVALILLGVTVHLLLRTGKNADAGKAGGSALLASSLAVSMLGLGSTVFRDNTCAYETRYFCVNIDKDPGRASGRVLVLDQLSHSYVDLDDPTHLEFAYIQGIVAGVEAVFPGGPVRAMHVGGGGFTVPRYLRSARPGSTNLVIERDAGLIALDEKYLGLRQGDGLTAISGDGRVLVREQSVGEWDVIVGDAFGGEAVPWHLATVEFAQDLKQRLAPGGLYALNAIDSPPEPGIPGKFIRAEVATVANVFAHVAMATSAAAWDGNEPDNFVVYASDRPLPLTAIQAGLDRFGQDWQLYSGDTLQAWVGDAQVLTDRFAPVDQLLTVG